MQRWKKALETTIIVWKKEEEEKQEGEAKEKEKEVWRSGNIKMLRNKWGITMKMRGGKKKRRRMRRKLKKRKPEEKVKEEKEVQKNDWGRFCLCRIGG